MTTAFWISKSGESSSRSANFTALKSAGLCLWFGMVGGIAERICYHFFPAPLGVDDLWWAAVSDLIFFSSLAIVFFLVGLAVHKEALEVISFFVCAALFLVDCISIAFPTPGNAEPVSLAALAAAVLLTLVFAALRRPAECVGALTLPILAIYVAIFIAYPPEQTGSNQRGQASAPAGAPNVLLIIVDTLEADHLSTYGYSRQTSPHLTALAAQGALFENAVAPSSWTLPSHASILTGRYASEHHAGQNDWRLDGRLPTLAEAFDRHGYSTAAFSANPYMFSRRVGLGRGYSHFEEGTFIQKVCLTNLLRRIQNRLMLAHLIRDAIGRENADEVNDGALSWIGEQRRPFFVTLNYFDVHEPFMPPSEYLHRFSKLSRPMNTFYWPPDIQPSPEQIHEEVNAYDAAISFTDQKISELVDGLKAKGVLQNTIVLITSDHGETFDQHGFMFHGRGLYWDLIHVPFIIYAPGRVPAGTRVSTPISLQSVPATLLDLVGISDEKEFQYASVAALWRNSEQQRSWPYAISELAHMGVSPRFPSYYGPMQSVVTPKWHFIAGGKRGKELYACCGEDEKNDLGSSPEGEALSAAFIETLNDQDGLTVTPQALVADLSRDKEQGRPALPTNPATHNGDRERMNNLIRALGYTP